MEYSDLSSATFHLSTGSGHHGRLSQFCRVDLVVDEGLLVVVGLELELLVRVVLVAVLTHRNVLMVVDTTTSESDHVLLRELRHHHRHYLRSSEEERE
jgi:hypothetical protein